MKLTSKEKKKVAQSVPITGDKLWTRVKKHWPLYVMLIPSIVYIFIFEYIPMYGIVGAFEDYKPYLGYDGSPWVGLKHFQRFITSNSFSKIVPNTIILSLYGLLAGFPAPILLALCVHYIPNKRYQKLVQNVTYAPHFISVVVIVSMLNLFFGYNDGFVNNIIESLGGERIRFMLQAKYFRHLYVWSGVWQNIGWNSVIYIAALAGVSPELHESAVLDGASKLQRIRHIDLPTILPTIVILLIMSTGNILDVGFDKVFLMQNNLNSSVSDVIATYTYQIGLMQGQFSYSTAIGLFKTVINVIMMCTVNAISRKVSEQSLW